MNWLTLRNVIILLIALAAVKEVLSMQQQVGIADALITLSVFALIAAVFFALYKMNRKS